MGLSNSKDKCVNCKNKSNDKRPFCRYGRNCKKEGFLHFMEFKHPFKTNKIYLFIHGTDCLNCRRKQTKKI